MSEPHDPRQTDRLWFWWAAVVVAGVLAFSMIVGLVILPVAQAQNANLSAWSAICRGLGLAPGTPAQKQPISTAQSSPVSQVRWSPETLRILGRADPGPGQLLAEEVCTSCHGEAGLTVSDDFPKMAGQTPEAIFKQLSDYRTGARYHPQMTPVSVGLTDSQLAQISAYFGHQFAGSALGEAQLAGGPSIQRLILRGDPARKIAPCESCHARGSGGPIEAPELRGQNAVYVARQLKAYKQGDRKNDVYRRMRDIASQLTDAEISELGAAYQGSY